jgi:hypothetical protein
MGVANQSCALIGGKDDFKPEQIEVHRNYRREQQESCYLGDVLAGDEGELGGG